MERWDGMEGCIPHVPFRSNVFGCLCLCLLVGDGTGAGIGLWCGRECRCATRVHVDASRWTFHEIKLW